MALYIALYRLIHTQLNVAEWKAYCMSASQAAAISDLGARAA